MRFWNLLMLCCCLGTSLGLPAFHYVIIGYLVRSWTNFYDSTGINTASARRRKQKPRQHRIRSNGFDWFSEESMLQYLSQAIAPCLSQTWQLPKLICSCNHQNSISLTWDTFSAWFLWRRCCWWISCFTFYRNFCNSTILSLSSFTTFSKTQMHSLGSSLWCSTKQMILALFCYVLLS